jgi:hypothetical protein
VSDGIQWVIGELQQFAQPQLQQQLQRIWLDCTFQLGVGILGAWYSCAVLRAASDVDTDAHFRASVLPAAKLALLLLQDDVQHVAAVLHGYGSSSGSSSGSSRSRRNAAGSASSAQQQQQQQQRRYTAPAQVVRFLAAFGPVVLDAATRATAAGPAAVQIANSWCKSDEVMQLLLAFAALQVGAAHKYLAAAAASSAPAGPSSRGSSSSSSGKLAGRRKAAAAAAAVPAASAVASSHLPLLGAVSPLLRQYVEAEGYGSFYIADSQILQDLAYKMLDGLYSVIVKRAQPLNVTVAMAASGLSGSSSTSSSTVTGVNMLITAVPQQQLLLVPLVLTVVELLLLLPAAAQRVMPWGLQLLVDLLRTVDFSMHDSRSSVIACNNRASSTASSSGNTGGRASSNAGWSEVVVADAVAAAVLLQLGPAVMQYLREAAAAGGIVSATDVHMVKWAYASLAAVILRTGRWL